MCVCCPSFILGYGLLLFVMVNIKSLVKVTTFIRKKKKYFLWTAGLTAFTSITTYLLIS